LRRIGFATTALDGFIGLSLGTICTVAIMAETALTSLCDFPHPQLAIPLVFPQI
jgi:hypothetical protein